MTQKIEVTQADREAAAEYMRLFPELRLPEAFARHRLAALAASSHPASAGDETREALAFIDKFFEPWGSWKTVWWESEVSGDAAFSADNALKHVANILRRALSATPAQEAEVVAYLVERIEGEGYGRARTVVDARWHNPTRSEFWADDDAKRRHRITPLYAISTAQEVDETERLRKALRKIDKWCCPVLCTNCADNRETARAAISSLAKGGE